VLKLRATLLNQKKSNFYSFSTLTQRAQALPNRIWPSLLGQRSSKNVQGLRAFDFCSRVPSVVVGLWAMTVAPKEEEESEVGLAITAIGTAYHTRSDGHDFVFAAAKKWKHEMETKYRAEKQKVLVTRVTIF
jgi:hypothetical protein